MAKHYDSQAQQALASVVDTAMRDVLTDIARENEKLRATMATHLEKRSVARDTVDGFWSGVEDYFSYLQEETDSSLAGDKQR